MHGAALCAERSGFPAVTLPVAALPAARSCRSGVRPGAVPAAAAPAVVSPCGRQVALRLSRRRAGAPAGCGAVGARAAPSRSAQSSVARPHRPRVALRRSAAPASRGVGRGASAWRRSREVSARTAAVSAFLQGKKKLGGRGRHGTGLRGTGSRGAAPHGTARYACPSAALRPATSQGTRSCGWETILERSSTKLRRCSGRPRCVSARSWVRSAGRAVPGCEKRRAAAAPRGWRGLREGRADGGLAAGRPSCLPGSGGPRGAPVACAVSGNSQEVRSESFGDRRFSAAERRACRAALAGDVRKKPRCGSAAGGRSRSPRGWRSAGASRSPAPREPQPG